MARCNGAGAGRDRHDRQLYQLAVGPTVAAGLGTQAIYYAANVAAATAGGNAVTVTFTAPPTLPDIRVAAYAGIDPVNPVDVTAEAQGTGATLDSGTGQTTFADDLLIGASLVAAPATTTPGAEYTARLLSSAGNLLEDRIVATVGQLPRHGSPVPLGRLDPADGGLPRSEPCAHPDQPGGSDSARSTKASGWRSRAAIRTTSR